jgi:putative SOS response-associated peptidase YedK
MSTNNARWDEKKGMPEKFTFKPAWWAGRRCLIPADDYDEPCYAVTGKNIWWRFARRDREPWMIAGLWSEWTDPTTGEIVPSYTMLTINCDAHPLLKFMHKPEVDKTTGLVLPADKQDKRSIVAIEREHFKTWLEGSKEEAAQLMRLPAVELFEHAPADPTITAALPI